MGQSIIIPKTISTQCTIFNMNWWPLAYYRKITNHQLVIFSQVHVSQHTKVGFYDITAFHFLISLEEGSFLSFAVDETCSTFVYCFVTSKGKTSIEKKVFFLALPEWGGALPMPEFFGPFSRGAFLVNKKSIFPQKCQCIELLTVCLTVFWRPKKGPSCPNWGQGAGGFRWFRQCPKENVFFFSLRPSLKTSNKFFSVCNKKKRIVARNKIVVFAAPGE